MGTEISIKMADKSETSVITTIKRYRNQLSGFIHSRVSNKNDAQDILQEVWYQLSRLTNLDEIENMSGWLYRVARNRITDSYRKSVPTPLGSFQNENDEEEFFFRNILLADETEHPEIGLFKDQFWKELASALDELPSNQREVFILNEIEDLTLQEIADNSGVNIKTIISRKRYAVKYLRRKLDYLYKELND